MVRCNFKCSLEKRLHVLVCVSLCLCACNGGSGGGGGYGGSDAVAVGRQFRVGSKLKIHKALSGRRG